MKQEAISTVKRLGIVLLPFLIVLAACQKPSEVELRPPDEATSVEIESIAIPDTGLAREGIDSSGVLPADLDRFSGFITLNDIRFELPNGSVHRLSYSRVLFENRLRPVLINNVRRGFFGIPLGQVLLNNEGMLPRIHHVAGSPAGAEYFRNLSGRYQPNSVYRWAAMPDSIGTFDVSILSPDDLTVRSPRSGSRLSRNDDLVVEWTGRGRLLLIISAEHPVRRRLVPVLAIRTRHDQRRAVIDRKILRALPRSDDFLLTFVLANREESTVVSRFPGRVLVQAASIYNIKVEFN